MASGRSRAIAAAGVLTWAYTFTFVVLGLSCRSFIFRPDNQIAIMVAFLAGGAMVWAGLNYDTSQTRALLGQLSAGVVAGLHFQPSSAMVLAGAVALLSIASLLARRNRLLAVALLAGGGVLGHFLMLSLMSVVAPASLAC